MSFAGGLHPAIDLLVRDRISPEDAERQTRTARAILDRLQDRAGLILADEVGMGKTFVALAVAVSVALNDARRRPVVVMVPPSVKEKWPRDFAVFREYCLPPELGAGLRCASASRAVEFLKLLDDPPQRRNRLIFLTHGAMSRRLGDPFVKLALIRQALKYRRDAPRLRRRFGRYGGDLLRMGWLQRRAPEIWRELLKRPPDRWLKVLQRRDVGRPGDSTSLTADDPVPAHLVEILPEIDTDRLYEALRQIPATKRKHYKARIRAARRAIDEELHELWREAVRRLRYRLPLLILDEAHHLKNAGTQLASLLDGPEAEDDAEEVSGGALGGVFERMLFLTATPFQLGHNELCNVLERFKGVAWKHRSAPEDGLAQLTADIETLRSKLDSAQEASLRLEQSWGRLGAEDLQVDGALYKTPDDWWRAAQGAGQLTPTAREAVNRVQFAKQQLAAVQDALRAWVIRHTRPRCLPAPFSKIQRRERLAGRAIHSDEESSGDGGIAVAGDAALPFLLAARLVACTPESRPVFAEGLASSYEAFLHTRRARKDDTAPLDVEDEMPAIDGLDDASRWYLDRIAAIADCYGDGVGVDHPKLGATVYRAMELWRRGEKVLIFCHYIATGRALREAISEAIDAYVRDGAAKQLGIRQRQVDRAIGPIAGHLDKGKPAARACSREVDRVLQGYKSLAPCAERLHDIVLRFLRRPSFIIRYFDLREGAITPEQVKRAFRTRDQSGLTIREVVDNFLHFLERRCGEADREAYLRAVETIQTGVHHGGEAVETDEDDGERHAFVSNVRLVNGATKHDTRQRLMLAFNTPFYPEILVTSSVMAEGVDLHLNCRHIIHHDLAWNPSNLEQRTGRIDRIGAKAERAGQPIRVYMPYIAESQDEKMYRVVMDRESWFNVVMGGEVVTDAKTAERIAERIPLPEAVQQELSIDLAL